MRSETLLTRVNLPFKIQPTLLVILFESHHTSCVPNGYGFVLYYCLTSIATFIRV